MSGTSLDVDFLTLRNITAYNPDGSFVEDGSILTIGQFGEVKWIDTASTIQTSTLIASYISSHIVSTSILNATSTVLVGTQGVTIQNQNPIGITDGLLVVSTNGLLGTNLYFNGGQVLIGGGPANYWDKADGNNIVNVNGGGVSTVGGLSVVGDANITGLTTITNSLNMTGNLSTTTVLAQYGNFSNKVTINGANGLLKANIISTTGGGIASNTTVTANTNVIANRNIIAGAGALGGYVSTSIMRMGTIGQIIGLSTINNDISIIGSAIINSTLQVSTLVTKNITADSLLVNSTLQVSTLVTKNITADSIVANSTLQVSSLITKNVTADSIVANSTLQVSNLVTKNITTDSIVANNTLQVSTLDSKNITADSLLVNSTLQVSTLASNNITSDSIVTNSTLQVSTLDSKNITTDSLLVNSTLQVSSISTTYIQGKLDYVGGITGSLLYQTSPNTTSTLNTGVNGQVLQMQSGIPKWVTPSNTSTIGTNNTEVYNYSDNSFNITKKVNTKIISANTILKASDIQAAVKSTPTYPVTYTFGVSNGQERYVGITQTSNSIVVSNDGIYWTPIQNQPFSNYATQVAYNGSMWVAVGYGGNSIAYSYDGLSWTYINYPGVGKSIAWNGSMWVATISANVNIIIYSCDGITWIQGNIINPSSYTIILGNITWNGSMWAINCIVYSTTNNANILLSQDGINWVFPSNMNPFNISNSDTPGSQCIIWTGHVFMLTFSFASNASYIAIYDPLKNIFYYINTDLNTINDIKLINDIIVYVGTSSGNNMGIINSLYGTTEPTMYNVSLLSNILSILYDGKSIILTDSGGNIAKADVTSSNLYNYDKQFVVYNNISSAPLYQIVYSGNIKQHSITIPKSGSMWVAVGDNNGDGSNTIAYSYDGIVWTGLGNIFSINGSGIAWNGTMWVAVGYSGTPSTSNTIVYSYDGINWTGLGDTIFTFGSGIAWNGTMWVAVGGNTNSIAYSYDGINWTGLGNSIFTSGGIGIAWNGSMWVAVGEGDNTIAYSYDGINWTGLGNSIFTSQGNGIAWNGTMWVAVGRGTNTIAYSYDGIMWTGLGDSIFTSAGNGIAWNGSMWVAVGFGTNSIAYSYDGINWTGLGNIFSTDGRGIAWNGTMWIAIGVGTNIIVYSYDGIVWIQSSNTIFSYSGYNIASNNISSQPPEPIVKINSKLVAVGYGTNNILYSYDGIKWTNSNNGYASNGIAWNGKMWVSVGNSSNTIAYSYDAINWTGLGNNIFTSGGAGNGVAWNGTIWVAVGEETNSIAYSYNGINWTGLGDTIFTQGFGIAWNGTMWIAVGNGDNTIAYSYDGINWIGLRNIFSRYGMGAAWNGFMWVAVGAGANTIVYSYDGINWFNTDNIFTNGQGQGIAWNGSMWVAVGEGDNTIAYSYDGINWVGLGAIFDGTHGGKGITWNGSSWTAVGTGTNTILYSYDGINWVGLGNIFGGTGAGAGIAGYIDAIPLFTNDKLTICAPEAYNSNLAQDVSITFNFNETSVLPKTPSVSFYYPNTPIELTAGATTNYYNPIVKGLPIKYYKSTDLPSYISLAHNTGLITITNPIATIDTSYDITGYAINGDNYTFTLYVTIN